MKIEEIVQTLIKNSKGTIFYGMHFYPGVAEYREDGKDPERIFLNEKTIRQMDPSFAGRPVFVEHVDGVEDDVDELRKEADGWVIESFFNEADGKHWAKFIVVSERGLRAIRNGYRLSNAYHPVGPYGAGGEWNGVTYAKQVMGGEYDHLAIIRNPRYEESIVMSPDEFKKYNEELRSELKRISNSKGETEMKLNLFKKQKVENSKDVDFEGMSVQLPKSGVEKTLVQIVNEADEMAVKAKEPQFANGDHLVKIGENQMSLNDLVKKHMEVCNELEKLKANAPDPMSEPGDDEILPNEGDDEDIENADDDQDEEVVDKDDKAKKNSKDGEEEDAEGEFEDDVEEEPAPKPVKNAKAKTPPKKDGKHFKTLKNAKNTVHQEEISVSTAYDQVQRGKELFGS